MSWYKQAKQTSWNQSIGDSVRYTIDAHEVKVAMTELPTRTTVSLTLLHASFGTIMWQEFWSYKKGEDGAKATYDKVAALTKRVVDKFVADATPSPMLHSYLREEVRHLDAEHKPSTRIPSVNWARQQDGVQDWRQSIYGTKYPSSEIEMF